MPKPLCREYENEATFLEDVKKVSGLGMRAITDTVERDGKKVLRLCAVKKRDTPEIRKTLGW